MESIYYIIEDSYCKIADRIEWLYNTRCSNPFSRDASFKEIWLPIPNFPGYLISSLGRVKSLPRLSTTIRNGVYTPIKVKGRFLATKPRVSGYAQVTLSFNGTQLHEWVHRLVAQAFVPNPNNLPNVLHGDDNRTNNNFRNLTWGTKVDNLQDRIRRRRSAMGSRQGSSKLLESDILKIRKLVSNGLTLKVVSSKFGVSISTISSIANNHSWKHV